MKLNTDPVTIEFDMTEEEYKAVLKRSREELEEEFKKQCKEYEKANTTYSL